MKASVQTIDAPVAGDKNRAAVFADLFKARLTLLVLLTTLTGFYLGTRGAANYSLMASTLLGMAMLASGGAALNQLFERRFDARMRRTQDRPLPSGKLTPQTVSNVGTLLSAMGVLWLSAWVNPLTGLLGAFTLLVYVFLYTPLKRVTWLNTLVGAGPGAMPPLMGWTAAHGGLTVEALALFSIQVLWQMPHFYAIAWIYRDDYAAAGFKMLPVVDPHGTATARQTVTLSSALLIASLYPFLLGFSGSAYLATALVLGIGFLYLAIQFARQLSLANARRLFYASILYLPALLGSMVLDKVR
jgi:protoheme IX farnesyltransferase